MSIGKYAIFSKIENSFSRNIWSVAKKILKNRINFKCVNMFKIYRWVQPFRNSKWLHELFLFVPTGWCKFYWEVFICLCSRNCKTFQQLFLEKFKVISKIRNVPWLLSIYFIFVSLGWIRLVPFFYVKVTF